jgi:hypothetical protein
MSELVSGLVLLGAYVVLVVLARWICIARTNMLWTRAQAGDNDGSSVLDGCGCQRRPGASGRLCSGRSMTSGRRLVGERRDIFGWNGSRQIRRVTMQEAAGAPALGHGCCLPAAGRARGQLAELPQPRQEAGIGVIHPARSQGRTDRRLDPHTAPSGGWTRDYRAYLDELGEVMGVQR